MIDKDTKIYASFSQTRGNTGTKIFNTCFRYYDLNALYRSFSVNNIGEAIRSARCLNFSGFAVSMPYKTKAIEHLDSMSEEAIEIGAINTVVNTNGALKGYNTDYLAAQHVLSKVAFKKIVILGNGGYAAAVKMAAHKLSLEYEIIDRQNWDRINTLKDETIFNCTPVKDVATHTTNKYIDCITSTPSGQHLALLQASYQFKLYTGLDFPLRLNNEIF